MAKYIETKNAEGGLLILNLESIVTISANGEGSIAHTFDGRHIALPHISYDKIKGLLEIVDV